MVITLVLSSSATPITIILPISSSNKGIIGDADMDNTNIKEIKGKAIDFNTTANFIKNKEI